MSLVLGLLNNGVMSKIDYIVLKFLGNLSHFFVLVKAQDGFLS